MLTAAHSERVFGKFILYFFPDTRLFKRGFYYFVELTFFRYAESSRSERNVVVYGRGEGVGFLKDHSHVFAEQIDVYALVVNIETADFKFARYFTALDPISTGKIEELMEDLKKDLTIIIVTHNMQQATRIADKTAYFLLGELIEYGDTEKIFSSPEDKRTENYITGRFG